MGDVHTEQPRYDVHVNVPALVIHSPTLCSEDVSLFVNQFMSKPFTDTSSALCICKLQPWNKETCCYRVSKAAKSRVFKVVSRATGTFVASLTDTAFIQEAN